MLHQCNAMNDAVDVYLEPVLAHIFIKYILLTALTVKSDDYYTFICRAIKVSISHDQSNFIILDDTGLWKVNALCLMYLYVRIRLNYWLF